MARSKSFSVFSLTMCTIVALATLLPTEVKGATVASTELIYSVNRSPESPFDTARAVQVITREEIWRHNARNLPELLMEEVGIFVQQTNYGGGSPIIRGLIGKQILILVDGVKINNATYRFGPIQYLSTIDLGWIERIEIVRGADSVLTGVALGGIINIITRKGPVEEEPAGGSAFARYSTADQGIVGRLEVAGRTPKYRYLVGATYRDSDNVEAGGDAGKLAGTGYDETGGNISLDYFLSDDRTLSFRYQALEQNEVPRTDRIASGRNVKFDFDPQRLQLASLVFSDLTDRRWSDSLQVTASWNRQDEGVQEIRSGALSTERRLDDSQTALGLSLEVGTFLGKSHRVLYGLDYFDEDIDSSRVDVNLNTGAVAPKRGRYTNGSGYETLGLYLQDRIDVNQRLTLTLGSRFNRFKTSGAEDSSVGQLDLQGSQKEITGSIGAVFRLNDATRLVSSITRAFRGPNIDDVSIFDARPEGTEVPNPGLEAETMLTYEVGVKHQGARFEGSAFYYISDLDDLIERSAGTFEGLPFFDANANGIQDAGEALVLQKQNIGQARIEGFEIDFQYRPVSQWTVYGNYADTRGENSADGSPLSRIPPAFGKLAVRWEGSSTRELWAELGFLFASSQRRVSSRDAGDDRIGPNGTDGFNVLNLRGGIRLGGKTRITLAWENIFDEEYKYHSSGLLRPGSHLVFGGELSF